MFGKLFGTPKGDEPKNALEATAEVLSIEDTGGSQGRDPIVRLKLKVQPANGAAFEMTGTCSVSVVTLPRVGDTIKIKYSATDPTQILVM